MENNIYVISAGRANDLPFTPEEKNRFIFCVKNGEGSLYRAAGCRNVHETGRLVPSRNWALNHAFAEGKICVQLSDDIKNVKVNKNFGKPDVVPLSAALEKMLQVFLKVPTKLMGIPPTSNDFFAKSLISENTFCIGDCLFVKPSAPRFDETMTLKEDYDFTLQHLATYGQCFRYQKYLFTFLHYKNAGGAVSYRSDSEEQKNIAILKAKWGDKVRLNSKRKNEVLI